MALYTVGLFPLFWFLNMTVNTIFCIGRNYAEHISELNNEKPTEPVVFLKPNSCLIHNTHKIVLPSFSHNVHYETELVLKIGCDADALNLDNALASISAVAVGLDLTARDVQDVAKNKGLPWTKAKGFKGAACVSDFIAVDAVENLQALEFTLHQNGELKQYGQTAKMIFSIAEILCFLAEIYGLRAGDLIFTGTPAGVGKLNSGDVLDLALQGLVHARFDVVSSC